MKPLRGGASITEHRELSGSEVDTKPMTQEQILPEAKGQCPESAGPNPGSKEPVPEAKGQVGDKSDEILSLKLMEDLKILDDYVDWEKAGAGDLEH